MYTNGGLVYAFVNRRTTVDPSYVALLELVEQEMPHIGFHVNSHDETLFCRENTVMEGFRRVTYLPYKPADYRALKESVTKVVWGSYDPR